MEKFFHFYVNTMRLEEKEAEYHISKFEIIEIPKKTNLTNAGEVENYLYFIDQGIVRFFINKSAKTRLKKLHFLSLQRILSQVLTILLSQENQVYTVFRP